MCRCRLLAAQLEEAVSSAEGIARQKHALEGRAAELERSLVQAEAQLAQVPAGGGCVCGRWPHAGWVVCVR